MVNSVIGRRARLLVNDMQLEQRYRRISRIWMIEALGLIQFTFSRSKLMSIGYHEGESSPALAIGGIPDHAQ